MTTARATSTARRVALAAAVLLAAAAAAAAASLPEDATPETPAPPTPAPPVGTAASLLEAEIAATDGLVAQLQRRLELLHELRTAVVSGSVSAAAAEALLAARSVVAEATSAMHAAPRELEQRRPQPAVAASDRAPAAAERGQPPAADAEWMRAHDFRRYLLPRRVLAPPTPPPPAPQADGGGEAAPPPPPAPLVSAFFIRLKGDSNGGGGSHRKGASARGRPPTRLAVRVFADGGVMVDGDAGPAAVCLDGGSAASTRPRCASIAANVLLPRAGGEVGGSAAGCRVVGAVYGGLPEATLLVADSCGRVAVMGVAVKHGGAALLGRTKPLPPPLSRERLEGGGSGPPPFAGTEVAVSPACVITLPPAFSAEPEARSQQAISNDGDAAQSVQIDASGEASPLGGVGGRRPVGAQPPSARPDVAAAMLTYTNGAFIDRGNVILVGTAVRGAVLAYHRNCTPAAAVVVPPRGAPAAPVSTMARQGTLVAYARAGSGDVSFLSIQQQRDRVEPLRHACDVPPGYDDEGAGLTGGAQQQLRPMSVTSLAYDALAPTLLWAGTSDGSLLLYNTRAVDVESGQLECRLLARVPHPHHAPAPRRPSVAARADCLLAASRTALSTAALRGYVVGVSAAGGVVVYNTSRAWQREVDVAFSRPAAASSDGDDACLVPLLASDGSDGAATQQALLLQPAALVAATFPELPSGGGGGKRSSYTGLASTDAALLVHEAAAPPPPPPPPAGGVTPTGDAAAVAPATAAATTVTTWFDAFLPVRREPSPWEADAAQFGSLLSLVRGPALMLGIGVFMWYSSHRKKQVAEGRRRRRDGDGGVWGPATGDGDDLDGPFGDEDGELGDDNNWMGKALRMGGQIASVLLLRGPLGVAARLAVSRYNKRKAEEAEDERREQEERERFLAGLADDDDGGLRRRRRGGGGGDSFEAALERLSAQHARSRRAGGPAGRRSGRYLDEVLSATSAAGGSSSFGGRGGRYDDDELREAAALAGLDGASFRSRGGGDGDGGLLSLRGGGSGNPYDYDTDDDDADGGGDGYDDDEGGGGRGGAYAAARPPPPHDGAAYPSAAGAGDGNDDDDDGIGELDYGDDGLSTAGEEVGDELLATASRWARYIPDPPAAASAAASDGPRLQPVADAAAAARAAATPRDAPDDVDDD